MHQKHFYLRQELLYGVIIFAIFIYEISYVSNASKEMKENMKQKEILEFNAQFEAYSGKENGYLNIKNAISIQEFSGLCNLVRDWNKRYPQDKIDIDIIERTSVSIKPYLKDSTKPLEELLTQIKEPDLYYFIFKSEDIEYNNENGRICNITMTMWKKV